MRDIYFPDREITQSTGEHVLVNGLGGKWKVEGLIARKTNSDFGSTIDAALLDGLHSIRVLLGTRSGDGHPPRPLASLKGTDGNLYTIKPGGVLALAAPRMAVRVEEGRLRIDGVARNRREARKLARRVFEKHGIPLERLEEFATETTDPIETGLTFDTSFPPESKRAVAKMACNLLAAHHRDLFAAAHFDQVRGYVAHGAGDLVAFVEPVECGASMGRFDHLIAVSGKSATGEVRGLVVLFGHLHYAVKLGNAPLVDDIKLSYRVDPIAERHRKQASGDLAVEVPGFSPDDGPQSDLWIARVGSLVRAVYSYMSFSKIFEESLGDVRRAKPKNEPLTVDDLDLLIHHVIQRLTPMVQRAVERRHREIEAPTETGVSAPLHDKDEDRAGEPADRT